MRASWPVLLVFVAVACGIDATGTLDPDALGETGNAGGSPFPDVPGGAGAGATPFPTEAGAGGSPFPEGNGGAPGGSPGGKAGSSNPGGEAGSPGGGGGDAGGGAGGSGGALNNAGGAGAGGSGGFSGQNTGGAGSQNTGGGGNAGAGVSGSSGQGGVVIAPGCSNGERDGNETDTDCGGSCKPCERGKECLAPKDCHKTPCQLGFCLPLDKLVSDAKTGCPDASFVETGACFFLVEGPLSWADAMGACAQQGGYLAVFQDQPQANKVLTGLGAQLTDEFWAGILCLPGKDCTDRQNFRWINNTPVDAQGWNGTEPDLGDQRCGRLVEGGEGWRFNNSPCGDPFRAVCEKLP